MIRRQLDGSIYRSLHDLTLPTPDGTTQIDHIIVSKFGVFVIETKCLAGWIFGDERSRRWTQVILKRQSRFQNPLHQNYKHLKAVQTLLDLDHRCVHSVVVFAGSGTFKTPMPSNVLERGRLIPYIKSKTGILLADAQVDDATPCARSGSVERCRLLGEPMSVTSGRTVRSPPVRGAAGLWNLEQRGAVPGQACSSGAAPASRAAELPSLPPKHSAAWRSDMSAQAPDMSEHRCLERLPARFGPLALTRRWVYL